jgi:hypothetical protein
MTFKELESRLLTLEAAVKELQQQVQGRNGAAPPSDVNASQQRHWWRDDAGRFADDPVFDEMVRLGRAYWESQRPSRQQKKQVRKTKRKNARS